MIKKGIENLEENLFVMVKELTPETTGNWCRYRDLIQKQMTHAMRIVVLVFSGVFLWVTLGDAVAASVISSGRLEAKLNGEPYLYEKGPSDGSIVPGGAWGKMSYA